MLGGSKRHVTVDLAFLCLVDRAWQAEDEELLSPTGLSLYLTVRIVLLTERTRTETMAKQACFLGIDVATGSTKALLIDSNGKVLAKQTASYDLSTPHPLWSEQDPGWWTAATDQVIAGVLSKAEVTGQQIAAVGLTGQMHGLVMLNAAGEVLRPALLWNDQRTEKQCDEIHQRVGRQRQIEITGKPALTGFTAPKMLWVREQEPQHWQAMKTMLLPKDYVRFYLTGEYATDVSDASGTSLLDLHTRAYSQEILSALEIDEGALPPVYESSEVCSTISKEAAERTGLVAGTPVVAGAGDQAAEAIGSGVVDSSCISAVVGTSGVVFAATDSPIVDPKGRMHGYAHATTGGWHIMGVMMSAGGSLRWYVDQVVGEGGSQDYDSLLEEAASVSPGCEGLVFLPYLTGERTPYADPFARAAFIGLTLRHGRPEMTRAVLEGVTFGLCQSVDLIRELGASPDAIRVSGGGVRSDLWRQMMADVFQIPVVTVNVTEGAAFGAALLAMVGAGQFDDVATASRSIVNEVLRTQPGEQSAAYKVPYERYKQTYPALQSFFQGYADS